MTKRADGKFRRAERDTYPTPDHAIAPLLPHLKPRTFFIEPCAGDGRLFRYLEQHGHHCVFAGDIEPGHSSVSRADVFEFDRDIALPDALPDDCRFITNPPWDRVILHRLIPHLASIRPTWLLFDADWMHTKQAETLGKWCRKVVSVGRVKWIEGSDSVGFDNCAWYLFGQPWGVVTEFHWRM